MKNTFDGAEKLFWVRDAGFLLAVCIVLGLSSIAFLMALVTNSDGAVVFALAFYCVGLILTAAWSTKSKKPRWLLACLVFFAIFMGVSYVVGAKPDRSEFRKVKQEMLKERESRLKVLSEEDTH